MISITEAEDEILTVYSTIATAEGVHTIWEDLPNQNPPQDNTTPWARVVTKHGDGRQNALSNVNGKRRWGMTGMLIMQVFTPYGGGKVLSKQLAQKLINAFRGAKGSVWYRNPRMKEVGKSGNYYQTNVMVDFEYDQTH